jgi:hypothetical protein
MRDQALEADWKVFRELRERALQRFCERVLAEIEQIRLDATKSDHARYLEIYRLIQRRDEELAGAFNDPRRSRLFVQLAQLRNLRLLHEDEYLRFSEQLRSSIDYVLGR